VSDKNLEYRLTLKDFFRKTMLGAADDTAKLDAGMNKLNRTIGNVGRAFGGYLAFSSIKDFVGDVVNSTSNMQAFNNSIIASSRSESEGRYNLMFLNEEVDHLGLSLQAAQSGYKTFNGAVMGSTIQGAKANKVFHQVASASTVMGLSAEQQEGAFLALGQMISKGTVQAEELRGQLGERIPGAFQIGARAMGMTSKQLGEAMKDGLVDSADFVVKFGNELEKTFGSKLETATHSTMSNLNRMGTGWERLKVSIGNSQSGIINSTVSFIAQSTAALTKYFDEANTMHNNFAENSAKQFGFWAKTANETIGILSGYNLGYSPMVEQENFQRQAYQKTTPKTLQEAYKNKSDLYTMSLQKDMEFKRNHFDRETADRFQATIQGALKVLNDRITGMKSINTTTKEDKAKDKSGNTKIGSPTEVSGVRPQNISIHVEKFGDVTMEVATVTEGVKETKTIWANQMLELLNDANLMARR
jgi:tape measure domain-containing protein